jgi:hypothetical protein
MINDARWAGRSQSESGPAILTHDVCHQARRSQTLDETSTEIFGRLCVWMRKDDVDIIAFRLPATVPGEWGFYYLEKKEKEEEIKRLYYDVEG